MITINVRRLDADTNNTISTYVVVGKYGTSKYDKPKIRIKLVGPTILIIPYIPCTRIATDS